MFTTKLLGDPHLGKVFRTGVPVHRQGERERLVWEDFTQQLDPSGALIHVCMGDLFDKTIVPPETILRAADNYLSAAHSFPSVLFVVLMGNHDVSRDTEKKSAFDVFTALVSGQTNIKVVRDEPLIETGFGFIPYSPFRGTEDLVRELPDGLEAVFGHWDVVDFGGDNVIPTELLAEKGITTAYTGHDHLARELTRHGVDIHVVGSMQPYSHAEDATGDWYVTLEMQDLPEYDLKDKCVRILLKEGEVLPTDLDCLAITAKRVNADAQEEVDTTDFDNFDLLTALKNCLPESVREEILEHFSNA